MYWDSLVLTANRMHRTSMAALRLTPFCMRRYVVKNNLFEEPVRAFLANGDTPNLLNSTFLEMIEFIRQADTKMVMLYFVDEYWPQVKHISYVRTFKLLKDAADNVRVRAPHSFFVSCCCCPSWHGPAMPDCS